MPSRYSCLALAEPPGRRRSRPEKELAVLTEDLLPI
jgi:hypothetical protein